MSTLHSAIQIEHERPFASSAMILRSLADGVLIADSDGIVRQTNPVAEMLLGISSAGLLGLPLADLPGGDRLSRSTTEPDGLIEAGDRVLHFSSMPLLSDDCTDSASGRLIILRDVTAELAAQQAQYDFVSRALHDVRVPLQAIGGTTEGLLRGWFGPLNDEQREFLGTIKENAARQGDLFSNIFDIYALKAHLLQLHTEQVHIEGLIYEVAHEYAARYDARAIELKIDIQKDLPAVIADRPRLRQVLLALFDNACKYTLANGHVEVRARVADGAIGVAMRDDGVGIRAVDRPRIFTPFFRGESPLKEGRYGGLNLAIAKMLVELHGGQMWFESVEGQGSTFSFTLPIPAAAPPPPQPTAR